MTRIVLPRAWTVSPWYCALRQWARRHVVLIALALAAVLAALAGLWLIRAQAAAPVEVVYNQPLRAGHAMPLSWLPAQAASTGRPQAALPVEFYDFGAVGSRDVVRHDFLIINRGSAPLVIQSVSTTCGCTTAEITASVIPPGKASRATLIFDAGYHPVAGQTVRRGLILETNDPERSELEIWVQAEVGR